MSALEFIKECQEKVFSGNHISAEDAEKLRAAISEHQDHISTLIDRARDVSG